MKNHTVVYANLGKAVRKKRLLYRFTLKALESRACVSKGTLSKMENEGVNITVETLLRLAKALYMSPEDLLAMAL